MRIKSEIFELIFEVGAQFFYNRNGTSNKWYIIGGKSLNGQVMTAYGSFKSGPGTIRSSKKTIFEIRNEKINKKGYTELTRSEFISEALSYNMIDASDVKDKETQEAKTAAVAMLKEENKKRAAAKKREEEAQKSIPKIDRSAQSAFLARISGLPQ